MLYEELEKMEKESYSKPYETYKMKRFEKLIKGYKPFTIFPKTSILDVRNVSKYNSEKWKLKSEPKNS